ITYITASDAKIWKEKYHHDADHQLPVINRLSPKVFPRFYRSPCPDRKEMTEMEQQGSFDNDLLSGSSDGCSSLAKRQSDGTPIDAKSIEKFAHNFVEIILKDIWQELLASEHLTKLSDFDESKKKWQPSLSELIEATPSTSVASREVPKQLISSIGRIDVLENLHRNENQVLIGSKISNINETEFENGKKYSLASEKEKDSEMVGRKRSSNEGSQKKPPEESSEIDNLPSQREMKRNSLIETELITPSMLSDSLSSPLSSETYLVILIPIFF
uniref:Uncharacterized protein n=1 Tax=Elaeophora elaphi TaxID=1147741 RepID=A0A0R3RMB3_9BILA